MSLIRFYISVFSKKFTLSETAVFVLLIGGTGASAAEPKDAIAIQGKKDFYNLSCMSYHKIDTTPAECVFGPDLTKFAARQKLGAGVAANTPENLHARLVEPSSLKPGWYMPLLRG